MTYGSTSFSSLDGIGSNIHVVGLDDLSNLYNFTSPIVVPLLSFAFWTWLIFIKVILGG